MHEIELKFLIPIHQQTALAQHLQNFGAKSQPLSAYYFDTSERLLAKNGIALRIRFEQNRWVQTVKTQGDGIAKRLEINKILPISATPAQINLATLLPDLTLIEHEAIIAQLEQIMPISKLNQQLSIQYFTDIERLSCVLVQGESQIELAYDVGVVGTGELATQQFAIHEIEFELLDGLPSDLVGLAKRFCQAYQLYFSTITKAERGSLLLKQQTFPTAKTFVAIKTADFDKNDKIIFIKIQQSINFILQILLPSVTAICLGDNAKQHQDNVQLCLENLQDIFHYFSQNPTNHLQSIHSICLQDLVESQAFQLFVLDLIDFTHLD